MNNDNSNKSINDNLVAHYKFDNPDHVGQDYSGNGNDLTEISPENKDVIEYAIGYNGDATGIKVYKQGIEAYTLGDYSSSTAAGNLRASCYEERITEKYTIPLLKMISMSM